MLKISESKEEKANRWVANAPLCGCGCGKFVSVNIEQGFKGRYREYPYSTFLHGHNTRKTDQSIVLTNDEIQLILGSLLGDASLLYAHSGCSAPRLIMNHGGKQLDYVEYKALELERLGGSVTLVKNGGYGEDNARFVSSTMECLKPFHDLMYLPKKRVTKELLDKLNYRAWAFWWLDDGTLNKDSIGGTLSTCSFSEAEHKLIQEYFYSFGIETVITFHKYFYIRFNKQGIVRFIQAINAMIPFGIMDYKFELSRYD